MTATRQLAVIMFTDIVGYTAMMGSDELKALDILRQSRKIQKQAVAEHGGEWLKEMGDGVLARFDSALNAVRCSLEIQQEASRSLEAKIRIGIHLGDVSIEDGDVFGDGVNIASRIQAIADPGGIYVSESIVQAIRGIHEVTYRLIGEVDLKNVDQPVRTYFLLEPYLPAPAQEKIRKLTGKARFSTLNKVVLILLVVLPITTGIIFLLGKGSSEIRSIAILPVANISGSDDIDYFASGVHEALISEVGKIGELRVPAKTSMLRYKDTKLTISEIAEELNVDGIIEASLYSIEDSIRLNITLIRAGEEDERLWNQQIIRDMKDILFMYEDVAKTVARQVNIVLTPQEEIYLRQAKEVNPAAYEAYLKGINHWGRLSKNDLDLAMKYFEMAREIDPDFAGAYAGIAAVWGGRAQQGLVSHQDLVENASAAAMKALELDSNRQEILAHIAMSSTWWEWKFRKAETYFKKALAVNPNDARTQSYYSHYLHIVHKRREGLQHAEQALKNDPYNPLIRGLYSMNLIYGRQFDEAIDKLTIVLQDAPQDPIALSTLRTAYHMKGMKSEAIDVWVRSFHVRGDSTAAAVIQNTFRSSGYSSAMAGLAELLVDRRKDGYISANQIATAYTRASMPDKALEWMKIAYQEHDPNVPHYSCDPIFDYMREMPEFQELIDKLNIPYDRTIASR